jgi:hypothetical protein
MSIIKVKTGGITADAITDALIADDVVGTEHLTANEVDTTALGADAVTGAQLADDAVNSEHYTDGSVDTAHIADAQITTAKLSTAVFTGATDIGADLADADLILVDDGAGGTIRKAALSRVKTYAGGVNTPIAIVKLSGTQTISNTTTTDVAFASETIDTASAFNTSNYTFTVPSGQAGIYQVSVNVRRSNFNASRFYLDIITGGGNFVLEHGDSGNGSNYNTVGGTIFTNLAESETIKIRVYHNAGGNGDLTSDGTYLAIMKLIQ